MNVNSTTTLELNALYGEMTSNITQIKNIDLLKKMNEMIKNFISKAHTSHSEEFVPRPKEELLDGFDKACKEVKLFQEGKTKLMSFDDMMGQLKKNVIKIENTIHIILLTMYDKSEQENISDSELLYLMEVNHLK